MSSSGTFVIVGGGLAGAKTAEALREQGFDGRVVLIGAEAHLPYERPALSKGYLNGSDERDTVFVHGADWYAEHQVELRLDVTVTRIDRAAHRVELSDGDDVGYDKLLLATGARPRRLDMPGRRCGRRLLPAHARRRGRVERAHQVDPPSRRHRCRLDRARGHRGGRARRRCRGDRGRGGRAAAAAGARRTRWPKCSRGLHREHGVDFALGASLTEITTSAGGATGVRLADGTLIDADAVLVAVGADPNVELAEAAGLHVDNGIVVDATLRTSDPDIFAAGDVANAFHPFYGRHIRVEHWANALNQGAAAAASMLGEHEQLRPVCRTSTPTSTTWAWSTSATPSRAATTRWSSGATLVGREFIAFWLADGASSPA